MEIAVQKGLGVCHKTEFKLAHLQVERLVLIELLLHKIPVRRIYIVPVIQIHIRFHEHKVFRDITQVRRDEFFHQLLLLLVVHDHIAAQKQGIDHKGGYVLSKPGEGLML